MSDRQHRLGPDAPHDASLPAPTPSGRSAEATTAQIETLLSALLRGGVLVSLAFIAIGTCVTLLHHSRELFLPHVDFTTWLSQQSPQRDAASVLRGALALQGRSIVSIGLMVLIATPILRVAVSLAIFRAQKDRRFMAMTALVLALLLLSLTLGRALG